MLRSILTKIEITKVKSGPSVTTIINEERERERDT